MLTSDEARAFAECWISSWNHRDIERVLEYFDDDVEVISPWMVMVLEEPSGILRGKELARKYWTNALDRIPDLNFKMLDLLVGVNSLVIYYKGVLGKVGAGVFFFDQNKKVVKAVAHYNE